MVKGMGGWWNKFGRKKHQRGGTEIKLNGQRLEWESGGTGMDYLISSVFGINKRRRHNKCNNFTHNLLLWVMGLEA